MFEYLRFPVAREKVDVKLHSWDWFDTVAFELRLPHEKIVQLEDLHGAWTSLKAHTRKELESLLRYSACHVCPFFASFCVVAWMKGPQSLCLTVGRGWHG